jgi:hypothetical protein
LDTSSAQVSLCHGGTSPQDAVEATEFPPSAFEAESRLTAPEDLPEPLATLPVEGGIGRTALAGGGLKAAGGFCALEGGLTVP